MLLSALLLAAQTSSAGSLVPLSPNADDLALRENALQARIKARVIADGGIVIATRGDIQGAIMNFARAIEIDATYSPAFYYRAAAHLRMNDFANAIRDLDRVIELDPNYSLALNDRGFARWQIGDLRGALEDLDRAIDLEPHFAMSYGNRAHVRARLGDMVGAEADVRRARAYDLSHEPGGTLR